MKSLYFKCSLLSDIIINQKSATEGEQLSLDFIPGNNFLGIVAQKVYPDKNVSDDLKLKLFHSGDVKFGDAHPAYKKSRALRIPSCIYSPKMKNVQDEAYISFLISKDKQKEMIKKQLKQCRDGFFVVEDKKFLPINIIKNFSLKSAHDKMNRRSEDNKMYGYQSLQRGMVYYFQVDIEDESLQNFIIDNLKGAHHIGRSKTAEYGSVSIDFLEQGYNTYNSSTETIPVFDKETNQCVAIYADSRLIFLDNNSGLPTARPTPEQMGVPEGEILWNKSQIRTFQYAPYNSARSTYDTDRYGIEKGSVIIIKTGTFKLPSSCWIGSYTNEGFGHVIYNPDFLKVTNQKTGASMRFGTEMGPLLYEEASNTNDSNSDKDLLNYLKRKYDEERNVEKVYSDVFKFVNENKGSFKSISFRSQWGNIRSIAMSEFKKERLIKLLYDEPNGYLVHGKAAKKWKDSNRLEKFKDFVAKTEEDYTQVAIINLASQMAKIYDNK